MPTALFSRSIRTVPMWNAAALILSSKEYSWRIRDFDPSPTTPGDITVPSTLISCLAINSDPALLRADGVLGAIQTKNGIIRTLLARGRTVVLLLAISDEEDEVFFRVQLGFQLNSRLRNEARIHLFPVRSSRDAAQIVYSLVTGFSAASDTYVGYITIKPILSL